MGRKTKSKVPQPPGTPRKAPAEKPSTDIERQYTRILGEQGADRRLSDVVRTCLRAIARRLPLGSRVRREAEAFLEKVIRLGELGALDLVGSPRAIATHIASVLDEEPLEARSVYRVLSALVEHTALVEHPSRQVWALRLSGLSDPSSPLHRTLLAETPSPYHLAERPDEPATHPKELHRQDPVAALRAELAELSRARYDDRRRLHRLETELAELRAQLRHEEPQPTPSTSTTDGPASAAELFSVAADEPSVPTEQQAPVLIEQVASASSMEAEPATATHAVLDAENENESSPVTSRDDSADARPSKESDVCDDENDDDGSPDQRLAGPSAPSNAPEPRRKRKRRRRRGGAPR